MNAVKCPQCGEGFDEKEFHWVTTAEGGVTYRLPCDHMVVGRWNKEGVVTYGPEHAWTGQARPGHDHHRRRRHPRWAACSPVSWHYHVMDYLDEILNEKLHEK
jgi:hypothetical protein